MMGTPRTTERQANESLVLGVVFHRGPLSRTEVAHITGLSKPTVSSIIDNLSASGLVQPYGRTQGRVGRSAALFHVDGSIGYAGGIDIGGTYLRVVIADIQGRTVGEVTANTDLTGASELETQIVDVARTCSEEAGVAWSDLRAITVGIPGAIDEQTGAVRLAPNIPSISGANLTKRLEDGERRTVRLENDVNLAAVGERFEGLAQEVENFAFIGVGTGLGAGLFIEGRLCGRGGAGAAGEIGFLPFGEDPFSGENRKRGQLEELVSGPGIAKQARRRIEEGERTRLAADCDAVDVFAAAVDGDPLAQDVVDSVGRHLALAVASVAVIVSPEIVILGGGVGANPILLSPVRRYVGRLLPEPPRIERTSLERATLAGALSLSLATARSMILGLRGRAESGEPAPNAAPASRDSALSSSA